MRNRVEVGEIRCKKLLQTADKVPVSTDTE